MLIRRRRSVVRASNDFFDETSQFKRQRSVAELKSANLNLYYGKSYKEFKNWTRNALNAFEISSFYFLSKWEKIRWTQQYMRKTPSQRWSNYKEKNLETASTIWFWKNFFKFLLNLIKDSKNRRLVAVQKYDSVRQKQSQSVSDFVIYLEMLENDLNEFIAVQKRDHLLYRLRKDIRERLQMMTNISITRNRLAALAQRIKGSQALKVDSGNKSRSDRDLNFEFHSKSTGQRSRRDEMMLDRADQTDNSIDKDRNDEIARLFLKGIDEQSNDSKDEKVCYNCDEKEHIASKCSKLK